MCSRPAIPSYTENGKHLLSTIEPSAVIIVKLAGGGAIVICSPRRGHEGCRWAVSDDTMCITRKKVARTRARCIPIARAEGGQVWNVDWTTDSRQQRPTIGRLASLTTKCGVSRQNRIAGTYYPSSTVFFSRSCSVLFLGRWECIPIPRSSRHPCDADPVDSASLTSWQTLLLFTTRISCLSTSSAHLVMRPITAEWPSSR